MNIRHFVGLSALGVCIAVGAFLPDRREEAEPNAAPLPSAVAKRSAEATPVWVPLAGEVMVNIHELPEAARSVEPWRLRYYCPADFNKDNHLDSADATLFLAVYAVREGPMVPWLDINQDGDVNEADLTAFFQSLQDGGCDPMHQAEVRGLIC